MGRVVIVAYKAKDPKDESQLKELEQLITGHWNVLNSLNLVSDRKPVIMKSADNSFIEVFEWQSERAIELAHELKEVQIMWDNFSNLCDFVPASEISELSQLFSEFSPVN